MIKAVIFDLDGTLIDTVDFHAESWARTFAHFGFSAKEADVRRLIGKASGPLMAEFVPTDTSDACRKEMETYRSDLFQREYLHRIKPSPDVPRLFRSIRSRGQRVGLASSCKQDEIGRYKEIAGIADLVDAEVTSDDVDRSKPAPDIFLACLAKLTGAAPHEAAVVGDSRYDAAAAVKAGMVPIGLLCGSSSEDELRRAGCIAIYGEPADLLRRYADSPLGREPAQRSDTLAAGPHSRASLTDPEKTPGSGVIAPLDGGEDPNMQPTS